MHKTQKFNLEEAGRRKGNATNLPYFFDRFMNKLQRVPFWIQEGCVSTHKQQVGIVQASRTFFYDRPS